MVVTVKTDLTTELGRGAYAEIYAGKWNGIDVAVKKILLSNLFLEREIDTMKNLKHKNVVTLLAVEEDEHFKYLILERALANVENYCRGEYKGEMPADPTALYQMADGLSYIHDQGLAHRDTSTGNVLIVLNGDEIVMKIADFGFCKPASENGSFSMSQGATGTRRFVAPEILKLMDVKIEKPRGSTTCDVFSLGCLFFVFLTKDKHPFTDGSIFMIPVNIINNKQHLGNLDVQHNYAKPLIDSSRTRKETCTH